ncbi:hypothetical protein MTO96_019897 [Rhipicephalus appendiculatus]
MRPAPLHEGPRGEIWRRVAAEALFNGSPLSERRRSSICQAALKLCRSAQERRSESALCMLWLAHVERTKLSFHASVRIVKNIAARWSRLCDGRGCSGGVAATVTCRSVRSAGRRPCCTVGRIAETKRANKRAVLSALGGGATGRCRSRRPEVAFPRRTRCAVPVDACVHFPLAAAVLGALCCRGCCLSASLRRALWACSAYRNFEGNSLPPKTSPHRIYFACERLGLRHRRKFHYSDTNLLILLFLIIVIVVLVVTATTIACLMIANTTEK